MEKLALLGGTPVKTTPFGTGKRFGEEELQQLKEALEQNTLFYWYGEKVKTFTQKFADMYGTKYCVATSSGTAGIHVALGAVGISCGDEVITSPITDMGTVIGILYQNAIPVFADLDPHTYNMDPKSIEKCITPKTKAILVVHLAGNAADMDEIMEIARKHNLKVIEDCAQSYECFYKGRRAGTIGDVGCFSLNDFKHISAGDGGMVVMNDYDTFIEAARFADKNYNRYSKDPLEMKNIPYLAPNYRMSELQGAVAIAQLDRVEKICKRRNEIGKKITEAIKDIKGLYAPLVREGNESSYWFYMMRLDPEEAGVDGETFVKALNAECPGIGASKGYIPACIYEYRMFQNKSAFRGTHAPWDSPYYGGTVSYEKGLCPVAEKILETAVKFGVSEFYTDQDVDDMIAAIRKVAAYYAK